MGKVRTRVLGLEEEEKKQKKEQKQKAEEKKSKKKPSEAVIESLKTAEKFDEAEDTDVVKDVTEPKKPKAKKTEEVKVKTASRGKKYQGAKKQVEKKSYTLNEALGLLRKIKYASFDESVEIHINTDEAGLKGEVELPHSTGKTVRVRIVDDTLIDELEKGKLEFDVLVTHPSYMPKLAKYAKVLGPKGLMPNPKAGTVSPTPEEVVKKFEKGTIRWKTEAKFPLIHQMIGKVSADEKNLIENAQTFLKSVGKNHIKEAFIKTTMSPSIKLDTESLS